jgi:copper ion binding protein
MFDIINGKEFYMKTILNVNGMTCEHCVKHVKEALEGITGVSAAKVNLKKKNALVKHEDTVSLDAMKAAVVEAGYEIA